MSQIPIRIASIGPADHGKSTLFGYLVLNHIDAVPYWTEMEKIKNKEWFRADRIYTYLFDQLSEEREGIVSEEGKLRYKGASRISAHINCNINGKKTLFIDVPGHQKFLKSATSGIFQAQTAVLVVAAPDLEKTIISFEEKERNPRRLFGRGENSASSNVLLCPVLARVYGFRNLILVISKMDCVDYQKNYFDLAMEELLPRITKYSGLKEKAVPLIPTSIDVLNRKDINVITPARAGGPMSWFEGNTVSETLAQIDPLDPADGSLLMPVETVYLKRIRNAPLVFTGRIMRGKVAEGQTVQVIPLFDRSTVGHKFKKIEGTVKSIVPRDQSKKLPWIGKFDQEREIPKGSFEAGHVVGLNIHPSPKFSWAKNSENYFRRGCIITDLQEKIVTGNIITAEVFIPTYSRPISVAEAWVTYLFGRNRGDSLVLSAKNIEEPFLSENGKAYAGYFAEIQILLSITVAYPDWKEKNSDYPRDIILRHHESFCGGLILGLCFPASIEISWEANDMLLSSEDILKLFKDSSRLNKLLCTWELNQDVNEAWNLTAFSPSFEDIITLFKNASKILSDTPSMTIIPNDI